MRMQAILFFCYQCQCLTHATTKMAFHLFVFLDIFCYLCTRMLNNFVIVMRKTLTIVLLLLTVAVHAFDWKMKKASELASVNAEKISSVGLNTSDWMLAEVPGTVLTSLVKNGVYPDPYFGTNNKKSRKLIPDIGDVGRDYYTYWFRTEFTLPQEYEGQRIWLQTDGINYRAEVWLNGYLVSTRTGMFLQDVVDITDFSKPGKVNALAILVFPVDLPGTTQQKPWGAVGEFRNGGDGNIGWNTTQLMTVGWDFTFDDGIRDRNTGIWRPVIIRTSREVQLRHPFARSVLSHPNYDEARVTASVELFNPSNDNQEVEYEVSGRLVGEDIAFSQKVKIGRGQHREVVFSSNDFPQLLIRNPRLWWPKNKGKQELYTLSFTVSRNGKVCDVVETRFGIREIQTTRETPDRSKLFLVNGRPTFIRGTNWLPEAMLRTNDQRMDAEMRLTAQSGVNLLRLWGGGIAESDRFYELCDSLGLLVWQEFWMTGDTRHPKDEQVYLSNVESTVKRIRNHPSVAFYVASNESSEVSGTPELLKRLDGTRPYQMQSECDGVHDGSPYKQVNPMQHYENTASDRGSRVDGFNPEYGAPTLPLVESLRQMMPREDLWPINKETWNYMDGNGFHLMTTRYKDLVDQYGPSEDIEEYCKKAQLLGAVNAKSIWEVWNYNRLNSGDRFCSGLLFWYHNSSNPQVCARMWDWSLEPTAALYHTMHALEPLHAQFDYLKNSVSVTNDLPQQFNGYTVEARIYDLNSRLVDTRRKVVDIPAEATACDVITLQFPENLTPVHFIYLELKDERGNLVGDNFYWRSNARYEGRDSNTGPCASGFEPLNQMASSRVKVTRKGQTFTVQNNSRQIAFFLQLHLFGPDDNPVKPAFYSDNFFTLLPGQKKMVTIESANPGRTLHLSGWNIETQIININ